MKRLGNLLGGRRQAHLLALEPRMMFDAAAVATAGAVMAQARDAASPDHHDGAAPPEATHVDAFHAPVDGSVTAAPVRTTAAPGHEIIFIDTSVADYQQLAAEWAARGEVVLVDSSRDGIAQVESALARESDVSAIHIVSHGDEGVFWLGTTRVDQASITGSLAGDFARIGDALAPGGDILVYGCDFAEGSDGAAALHSLASATGADVAASTDLTGAADRGGDWVLEAQDGAIHTRALSSADWDHVLGPNTPVPIAVTANSLTVTDASGTVLVTGTTGYGTDGRSPDITATGATAVWANAATYQGQALDLKATVVALSTGDAVRFNQPGVGANGDDATFLLRDLTTGNSDATVSIKWELVLHGTNTEAPADVEFTIGDIDGIGGQPDTRESVSTSTDHLAYFTREKVSDINFTSSLSAITASGTQNENTDTTKPESSASNATFDWSDVPSFTLNYKLTTNTVTTLAQFYQDGNATLVYTDPVYVSIPHLDLDGDDSTAAGNDAHFTYTEDGAAVPVVDSDVRVTNPMPSTGIVGATVVLTNAQAGDVLNVGTLPANITDTVTSAGGRITVTLTGNGSEADYQDALKAISFSNTLAARPDTTQRVIDVTFSNDTLTSATAVSRIDVIDVNHAPAAVGTLPARATVDAASVSYATAGAFTDVDGDTLAYSASGLPAGLAIDPATGVISGTVDRSASQVGGGVYNVVVTATDPSHTAASQPFRLTVTNPPPTAVDDSATTAEDTAVAIAVLANDSDPDHDPLTVTAASALHGSVVRNADGTVTYTPDANYNGSDTISYTISDGQGGTSAAKVAVTITPVNDAPTAVGTLPARATVDAASVSYATAGAFTDVDGDTLTYSASGLPAGLAIDPATGVISGTVDRSASQVGGGVYSVVVTATDPSHTAASQPFRLTVTNPPPTAVDDSATTHVDTPVDIAVLANDGDPDGDPIAVTGATAGHGTVAINPDGSLHYTPSAGFAGTDTIDYAISDGQGGTAHAVVTVSVTDTPPAVTPIADQAAQDGQAVSLPLGADFSDADGDTLTYSASGLPAGLTIDSATGVVSGTIDRSASQVGGGVYTSIVTADDGHGGIGSTTVRWTITNPAPIARDDSATTPENTAVVLAPLANDSDPDGDPLTIESAVASHGSVTLNADGTLGYTPDAGFVGQDTVAYGISDGQGGHASATIMITVVSTDRPPVAAPDQAATRADTPVTIAVLANDSDPDGDVLSVTAAQADHGSVAINPNGTITYTPAAGFAGSDTISYTVSDGRGGIAGSTATIAVLAADRPPVAAPDQAATRADTPVTVAVLANDSDPDGDVLSVTAAQADHGSVAINPDGTVTYTPAAGFAGSDTISYTISDGRGGSAGSTATIAVLAADRPPVAAPDQAATRADTPVTVAVLANDSDPDGDALSVTAAQADHGSVAINPDGTITYTPAAGFAGTDTISYTISDGRGGTARSTAAVTVTADRVPVIDPQAPLDTVAGRALRIDPLRGAHDPDGDPLTIVSASAAAGAVAINPDGTLLFTPAPGFVGTASVSYTLSDGRGGTASATVIVRVASPAAAPAADVNQLLAIGRGLSPAWESSFGADGGFDPARPILVPDGLIRSPFPTLSTINAINAIRPLHGTADLSGATPILDAVDAVESLGSISAGGASAYPVGEEVARLGRLADFRDAAARMFDHRWGDIGDFGAHPFIGFSTAADHGTGVMIETLMQGGAIYLDVRDTAPDGRPPIRSIDVTPAGGGAVPWITVDHRGFAIIEAAAASDEIRLTVTVTRQDGSRTSTRVVVQRATGEVELDRHPIAPHPARSARLDATLHTPHTAAHAAAAKLSRNFQ